MILFDFNDDNKQKIKAYFQKYILLYYFKYAYITSKENNISDFLTKESNKDSINKIFDLYKLKYQICLMLFGEKEENLNVNFEESMDLIKKELGEEKNNDLILSKEVNIELPKFKIIELPKSMVELCSKYSLLPCSNCQKKKVNYYICLLCGNKICTDMDCIKVIKVGLKEYSLIYHSIICNGGNCFFVDARNSQIIYLLKRRFLLSSYNIYRNSYGEYPQSSNLDDSYILNQPELEKACQSYIDLTFRNLKFRREKITE